MLSWGAPENRSQAMLCCGFSNLSHMTSFFLFIIAPTLSLAGLKTFPLDCAIVMLFSLATKSKSTADCLTK